MKMRSLFFLLIIAGYYQASAQVDPVDRNGIAIGGYDVAAYFESGMALKGNRQFAKQFNGVTYLFKSKENLQLFEANPLKYLPQYDGYCALAVSYGKKISIDPETFKLIDGKLYLFYKGRTSNGTYNSLETWNKSEPRLLKKADLAWPDVKKKKYHPEDTL
jgi:YHS domain-containing protein